MATYTLTLIEQQQLTAAFNQGPTEDWEVGTHIEFYQTLASILSTDNGSGAPGDDPEIKPIMIWAQGATKTNSKQGAFSTLIREYTHEQGVLHWQRRFTDSNIPNQVSEMQEASNRIARNAYANISGPNNWTVQTISEIANLDAVGVGEVLFDFPEGAGDTINSDINNAAWSGVPFFSSFDDKNGLYPADETYRLIGADENAVLDNLDDLRNVLYSQHSFNYGVVKSLKSAGAMVSDLEEWGELFVDAKTYVEVCQFSGRCDTTFATTVRGQVAEQAAQPSLLYGVTDTVNLIKSAQEGVVNRSALKVGVSHKDNLSFATNFRDQARALFGPPGPQNQYIPASVETPGVLVSEAIGGDNVAKKSLQGLSPFKIHNGTTVNVNVSNQYWVDRGLMTEARLLFDARDLISYGGSVTSSSFVDSVEFMDMQSNMSLKVYNGKQIPPEFKQIEFGTENADSLSGGDFADNLYGLNGADFLNGGQGNDFLFGGEGFDSYEINEGRDTILDSDGQGSVELNGEILIGGDRIGGSVWDSADGRFRYQLINTFQGSQLIVNDLVPGGGGSLIVNDFTSGNLGIDLSNSNNPLPPIDTTAPIDSATIGTLDNYDLGSSGNDYYDAGNLYDIVSDFQGGHDVVLLGSDDGFSDRASTAFGNDTIYGEEGNDYIEAGVGFNNAVNGPVDKDTVIGGADVDLISTGVGDDVIIAGEEGENINATNTSDQGDWIVADEGNDVAYGTGNQDFITMGTGADVVYAGGGFDVILADGYYRFNSPVAYITPVPYGAREHKWNGSSWDTTSINFALLTPGSAFDFTTSIDSGGDFVFTPLASLPDADRVQTEISDSNDDIVFAGPGPDWISGGPGSDTLRGEADDDIIYGDDLVAMPAGSIYGDDVLFGGSGDDLLFGNQGNDVLSGGLGDDMLMGDDMGEPSGNDSLFGGDGVDELYGFGGDDYLSGGSGNETVLMGGDGNDIIDGNHGDDVLTGGSGNDNLHGGQGNDQLDGGDDNDFLNGGEGDDTLNGEAGNDTLFSTSGLNQLNGGAGDDVYVAALNNSPSDNPDVISDSGGYDKIQFDEMVFSNRIQFTDQGGDLLVQYSPKDALLVSGGAGGAVIEEYEFFDGRVLTYGDLNSIAKVSRGSSNEISAFDDWYEGDATIQNLDMLAGNDAAFGYGGNDILTGGAGNDLLDGGIDHDTLYGGLGNDRLFGATGDDQINGGAGEDLLAAGDGADTLDGGSGIDVLAGGFGDDLLVGGDGNDYLQGDEGADTLEGGLGFDTYVFKSGDDHEPGIMPKTSIIDTNDAGGNAIMFIGGLDSNDITLINDLDTGDLEIQYAYQGNPIVSTIYVANSAEGEVVAEFQFDDGTTMTFEDLCLAQPATCEVDDLIFENGFEQAQLMTDKVSVDHLSPDPFFAISLILSLAYQRVFT